MRVLPSLLRVLLVVVLVLNGVASAHASVAMLRMSGQHHGSTQAADDTAPAPPCEIHQDTTAKRMDASVAPESEGASAQADRSGTPAPDCCTPGQCACPCVHGLVALALPATRMPSSSHRHISARRLALGHASPALPHLIRPPIV